MKLHEITLVFLKSFVFLGLVTLSTSCVEMKNDPFGLSVSSPAVTATPAQIITVSATPTATPVATPIPTPAAFVMAETIGSCARFANGTLKCWGNDPEPGGSSRTFNETNIATTIPAATGAISSYIRGSGSYSIGFIMGGQIYDVSGQAASTQNASLTSPATGLPANITSFSDGSYDGCFTVGGSVYCYGNDQFGNLGGSSLSTAVVGVSNAVSVNMSTYHTCALSSGGHLNCWGHNRYGQVSGTPNTGAWWNGDPVTPVPSLPVISQVALGEFFSCATSLVGQVYCWGDNSFSQLAGSSLTTPIPGLSNVTELEAGLEFACALSSGHVYCWGHNDYGQVGDVAFGGSVSTPTLVPGLSNVTSIAVGAGHACAMINYGDSVYCWGRNDHFQTGNASSSDYSVTAVPNIP